MGVLYEQEDSLYTEPMNLTSPESTNGLVVNHSHKKAEAAYFSDGLRASTSDES